MTENSVRTIIDAIGIETMKSRLRVSQYSVRHARVSGSFPASWFDIVEGMCLERGLDCPRDVFNFKASDSAPVKRGNANATAQGQAPKEVQQ